MVQQLDQLVYFAAYHAMKLFASIFFMYYLERVEEYYRTEGENKKKAGIPPDTVKVFPLVFSAHGA